VKGGYQVKRNAKIVNLLGRDIVFFLEKGSARYMSREKLEVKDVEERERLGEINDIPVNRIHLKEKAQLPEPDEGTVYIVPRNIARAYPERDDLYVPGSIMMDNKHVLGCRELIKL